MSVADIPNHPSIQLYRPVGQENGQEVPDTLMRITRPTTTRCPDPPESIAGWLAPRWDDPSKPAEYAESKNEIGRDGETLTVKFEDDELRISDYITWDDQRLAWAGPERIARSALRFFEVFNEIHATLKQDGEEYELLVADGHLSWQTISGVDGQIVIDHPILFKRVELWFDANIPEFTIHETDRESELYGNLFVDIEEVDPVAIRERKEELAAFGYHPLGWEDTESFIKTLIQTISPTRGEFLSARAEGAPTATPRIWRDPVLLLRKRSAGIANAVDAIIDDIDRQEVFPPALEQITGTMAEWTGQGLGDPSGGKEASVQDSATMAINDDDILLAKETNEEQRQIVRRLQTSGAVIVQGPPGTGKTHSIGNIIGHLLAQGKSILVTAQTAKALRVLRDQVPGVLQPLCVSVLGNDKDAKTQLESSIGSITERLTTDSSATLLNKAKRFDAERRELLRRINELRHNLRAALENEYREIRVGDRQFSPSDAARFVASHKETHSWIPSPVKLNANVCLTDQELARLYALGESFTDQEGADAQLPLPELTGLPSERQFQMMVSEYKQLLASDLSLSSDLWSEGNDSATLEAVANTIHSEFSDDLRRQSWRPYAIVAGIHGGVEREVWEKLISYAENAATANAQHALVLHHRPHLSGTLPVHTQRQIAIEICDYLAGGGKLGFIQLTTRPEWRKFIKTVSVTAGQPVHKDHFEAIRCLAELESYRLDLELPWNNLIGRHIETPFDALGASPELSVRALIPEIWRCLNWHASVWLPLLKELRTEGLQLDRVLASLPREASQLSEYTFIERLATEVLPPMLESELGRRRVRESEGWFDQLTNMSVQVDSTSQDKGCIGQVIAATQSRDSDAYKVALNYARRLHTVKPLVAEREVLLAKLQFVAPGWSDHISRRVKPHNGGQIPGDLDLAWTWRQLSDTLADRDQLDAHELQAEMDNARATLRQITEWLIDAKAWGKQLERLQGNQAVKQALVGWLDTTKRLLSTRQIIKRQTLLTEARQLMTQCADSVPVWIMPISLMAESFDPKTTRFDVVIIDEASQADLNALIPVYMGKQIVVVGDHEQVTPLGVGQQETILENLRKSMLQGIPNSHLFDNMSSIYDIGRQSFGDAIRLVEHFRCVPEIIAFSNQLSYEGKIRPLRESNSTHIKPACVPYRVEGVREGDINKKEAETIVALIKGMTRHQAYAGKTIGVISMLKQAQATLIQTMLYREIDSVEMETRRIQSGIAAAFQGDERDIIFLSMVDSPEEEGTLRSTGEGAFELTKKRYNVAASRARDQLWVVHSFDPHLHLKSTDLRFRLLQHVEDPEASIRAFDQEVRRTESPFEREVLKRLTIAGFRVKTQWKVGYYRIDLVVEGGNKRLAVECDGDRYHPIEKLAEDIERQSILERLGWQFERIRGSAFYRDPDGAMKPVFDRLHDLGILPEHDDAERPPPDMMLIHELENLLVKGSDTLDPEGWHPPDDTSTTSATISPTESPRDALGQRATSSVSELRPNLVIEESRAQPTPSSQTFQAHRNSIVFAPYTAFDGNPGPDPRDAITAEVAEGLCRIIEVEGPMSAKRAYDVYRRRCGIGRLGSELRRSMNRALEHALRDGRIVKQDESGEGDLIHMIVRSRDAPSVRLRTVGPREFQDIPPSELQLVGRLLSKYEGLEVGSEEHLKRIRDSFGLQRLRAQTRDSLMVSLASTFSYVDEIIEREI